jgi:hypothetical protein
MTTNTRDMSEALKAAAQRAGMHDHLDAALADLSRDDGTASAAELIVAELKAAKPFLFVMKHMRDMTPVEQAEWWREHARQFPGGAPRPAPMDLSKKAKDMTERERQEFIRECSKRAG